MVDPETMSIVELYHVVITMGEHFSKDLARIYDRREFVVKADPRNATPCIDVFQPIRTADSKKTERENSERRLALELDIFERERKGQKQSFRALIPRHNA